MAGDQEFNRPGGVGKPQLPSYLTQAILTTIFCCLPFGIISIVFAAQVNGFLATGDWARAEKASQRAKTWAWWAFIIGLIEKTLLIIVLIAAVTLWVYAAGRAPAPGP